MLDLHIRTARPRLSIEGQPRRPWARHASVAILLGAILASLVLPVVAAATPTDQPPRPDNYFRKAPYVIFEGNETEMRVLWQTALATQCTLSWGTDTSYSVGSEITTEYSPVRQHAWTIGQLVPGELCYYRVALPGESYTGLFRAAPDTNATRVKLLAYGDTRSYPAAYDAVAAAVIGAYTADPELRTISLVTGDLVNNGNSESDWDVQFFSPARTNIRQFHADVPCLSARGNHEGSAILFERYLPYPGIVGRSWSYDYGPVHCTVIDQYVSYTPGSPQYDWIVQDLATTDKPWKIVYLHEPGWSAGGGHSNNVTVQTYLQPLFEEYDVHLVLAGHNHYYSRCLVGDVHHITTGGGGAPLRAPEPSYPYIVSTEQAYHYCTIDVDGDLLDFTAFRTNGTVIDSFRIDLNWTDVADPVDAVVKPSLSLASPNPFSQDTEIAFMLPEEAHTRLTVHSVGGRLVATLVDRTLSAGRHAVGWDGTESNGSTAANGVYFCRLATPAATDERSVILLR